MSSLKTCLLIPVYNHGEFVAAVLRASRGLNLPTMVVNDGSTDATGEQLKAWPELDVITFPANQGKGRALAAGLKRAGERGFDLAVTLDADGQHDPQEVPKLLAAAGDRADILVIGSREAGQDGAPLKSRFGRKFSNFWVWVETGRRLPDTQSGFRVYPVRVMNGLKISSRRFGWEIEALVRAAWAGVRTESVGIRISYAAKSRSHFRTFRDFFLVSCVNVRLVNGSVMRKLLPPLTSVPSEPVPDTLRGKLRYLWDHYLWVRGEPAGPRAWAIGVGAFCSVFPVWGWQTILALVLARSFRLNRVLVLAAVNLSLPPVIPVIVYAALVSGHFLLTGKWVWALPLAGLTLATAQSYLKEFLLGSCVLSVLAGALAGLGSYALLCLFDSRSRRQS